jgi:hypothetical protein
VGAIGRFADTNPVFDCNACHQSSSYAGSPSSPNTFASLWRDLLGILQTRVDA